MIEPKEASFFFNPIIRRFIYLTPELIQTIGVLGLIFFGVTLSYGIKKLFDKKIGLIIDSKGITDNSNASSIGLIEWNDISEIRTKKVLSTKFLLIDVVNPDKYIQKAKSKFQAKLINLNMNRYKTPITITTNILKYDFEELKKLIHTEHKRNKNAR